MSFRDFLLGQTLSNKGDSQTTPQPPNQGLHVGHTHGFSRRGFIHTVSFKVEWDATGPPEQLGSGNAVPATDPASFLGTFAPARSTGQFSGAELGFSLSSKRGASSDLGYAQIGTERNGIFLS